MPPFWGTPQPGPAFVDTTQIDHLAGMLRMGLAATREDKLIVSVAFHFFGIGWDVQEKNKHLCTETKNKNKDVIKEL